MCAVPISAGGNNCGRVCTSQLALTNQLDLVAVGNAPVTVDLISLLGPIMCDALLGGSFIQLVKNDLAANPHDGGGNDDVRSNELGHDGVV